MSLRSTLLASALTLAFIVVSYAAHAGQYTIAPGAQAYVDVSAQGNYTTITIQNSGTAAGAAEFAAPLSLTVEVAGGQRQEIYSPLRTRGSILVRNTGQSPLVVTSSYTDRPPAP